MGKSYDLTENGILKLKEIIIKVVNNYKEEHNIGQGEFCTRLGMNDDGPFRHLRDKRVKGKIQKEQVCAYYKMYMLDTEEHCIGDYCSFFKEDIQEEIKNMLKEIDIGVLKREMLGKTDEINAQSQNNGKNVSDKKALNEDNHSEGIKQEENNADISEKETVVKSDETKDQNDEVKVSDKDRPKRKKFVGKKKYKNKLFKDNSGDKVIKIPSIVTGINDYLKKYVCEDVDIQLSEIRKEKYIKFDCIDNRKYFDDTITVPLMFDNILVMTYLNYSEELQIIRENQDIDLFILIHKKDCKMLKEQFEKMSERDPGIMEETILEVIETSPGIVRIINNPYGFEIENFFNSEIKIEYSEIIQEHGNEISEIKKFFDSLGIRVEDLDPLG